MSECGYNPYSDALSRHNEDKRRGSIDLPQDCAPSRTEISGKAFNVAKKIGEIIDMKDVSLGEFSQLIKSCAGILLEAFLKMHPDVQGGLGDIQVIITHNPTGIEYQLAFSVVNPSEENDAEEDFDEIPFGGEDD